MQDLQAVALLGSAWVKRVRNQRCLAIWLWVPSLGLSAGGLSVVIGWLSAPQRPRRNSRIACRSFPTTRVHRLERWSSRWCPRQSGTGLFGHAPLRPSARFRAKVRWRASDGRLQIKQGCFASQI